MNVDSIYQYDSDCKNIYRNKHEEKHHNGKQFYFIYIKERRLDLCVYICLSRKLKASFDIFTKKDIKYMARTEEEAIDFLKKYTKEKNKKLVFIPQSKKLVL